MNYVVIMEYKCTGRLCRVYEVDAESEEDAIKLASSGKGYNGEGVQEIQFDAIVEALNREFDVVIDNTNLNNKVLDQFNRLIKTFEDYEIEYKDFFDTPLSVCIERDKNRDLQVTEKVIRSFYNNYKDKYPLNGN